MKKAIAFTALLLLVANSAFAAALASGAATTAAASVYGGVDANAALNAPTPLIKFSTGVNGIVVFTDNTGYLVATKHSTGSKMFGTNNAVNNIYWKQAAAGALDGTMLGITTPVSSNFVGNGWTSY